MTQKVATMPRMKDEVDLIASGYDWFCPNCGADNHVTAIPKGGELTGEVSCNECGHEFKVRSINHARD